MAAGIFTCTDCVEGDGLTPADLEAMERYAVALGIMSEVIGSTAYDAIIATVKAAYPE